MNEGYALFFDIRRLKKRSKFLPLPRKRPLINGKVTKYDIVTKRRTHCLCHRMAEANKSPSATQASGRIRRL